MPVRCWGSAAPPLISLGEQLLPLLPLLRRPCIIIYTSLHNLDWHCTLYTLNKELESGMGGWPRHIIITGMVLLSMHNIHMSHQCVRTKEMKKQTSVVWVQYIRLWPVKQLGPSPFSTITYSKELLHDFVTGYMYIWPDVDQLYFSVLLESKVISLGFRSRFKPLRLKHYLHYCHSDWWLPISQQNGTV